jgi:hypothetical protein
MSSSTKRPPSLMLDADTQTDLLMTPAAHIKMDSSNNDLLEHITISEIKIMSRLNELEIQNTEMRQQLLRVCQHLFISNPY